jgi:hypothetical protein
MGEKHSKSTARKAADATPELRAQIAALAEQVRRLTEPAPSASAAPAVTVETRADPLAGELIALAEHVANEIRDSARREAARIRTHPPDSVPDAMPEVLAALRRQRETVSALAAEVGRLEQDAGILRARVRALEAELSQLDEILATPGTASPPGASPGTSPHRRG